MRRIREHVFLSSIVLICILLVLTHFDSGENNNGTANLRFTNLFYHWIHTSCRIFPHTTTFSEDGQQHKQESKQQLHTTVCLDNKCTKDCTLPPFITPALQCYNVQNQLFGQNDIFDEIFYSSDETLAVAFKRSFFNSTNNTCSGGVIDTFDYIPLNECIGPFGPPKPWGMFEFR